MGPRLAFDVFPLYVTLYARGGSRRPDALLHHPSHSEAGLCPSSPISHQHGSRSGSARAGEPPKSWTVSMSSLVYSVLYPRGFSGGVFPHIYASALSGACRAVFENLDQGTRTKPYGGQRSSPAAG